MLPVQGLLFFVTCDTMSRLLSQYGSTCRLLPCDSTSEISKHKQHVVFVLLCEHLGHPLCTHFPITQMTTDNIIESLKSVVNAGTDKILWNVCRHALFR